MYNTASKIRLNGGEDRYISNWQGVNLLNKVQSTIMYSATHMVDVIDGDKFYLGVDLFRFITNSASEAMTGYIHIVEI